MKGLYIVYTNINREGWKKALQTPSRQTFEYYISRLYGYDEPVAVITKYQTPKGDFPLVSFHNKIPNKTYDLEKVYRYLPKEK